MPFDLKPGRRQSADAARACVNDECLSARAAEEVMVMAGVGRLVSHIMAGERHRMQPACIKHPSNIAIDRGDAQLGHFLRSKLKNLVGMQRPISCLNDLMNGMTLIGFPYVHDDSLNHAPWMTSVCVRWAIKR